MSRLTLPIQTGMDDEIRALVRRLQPDAVRNSDGTELPEIAKELVDKVYSTYFPSRGDHEWSRAHPDQRVNQFLMSERKVAGEGALEIDVMEGYFSQQFTPALDVDLAKYWQVIDRTAARTLGIAEWTVAPAPARPIDRAAEAANSGPRDEEAASARVIIANPVPGHVYTVNFLARQIWDSTQIYNYLTNNWANEQGRQKDKTYDPAYAETWEHMQSALDTWLAEHPEVDVVRFTTFFYHFTLVFNEEAREKYVDWFGYSAAVSVPALEKFAREKGYELTPEDFVDAGYYNSPFRPPSPRFLDWIDFTSREVATKAARLVSKVRAAGRESIMFLGDNWAGTEPYGKYFPGIALDGVVGSVGNAATCRMISDIPGVRYTEGRFLPYFFPDVFNDEGDPVGEATASWVSARRAIVRSPLDRMGYGGYLSLAAKRPEFIDRVEEIVTEFRQIHDQSGGERPANAPLKVGVVNAWGKLRSWQTHMVAHALPYRETDNYVGVLEALAGLPFEVEFLTFAQVAEGDYAADVLVNVGSRGTAFSGGPVWQDEVVQIAFRRHVSRGGGLIGVGEPSANDHVAAGRSGFAFALADVYGVDQELHWSLSTDKYPKPAPEHFIFADGALEITDETDGIFAISRNTLELARTRKGLTAAAHEYGQGRAVYFGGLPYTPLNARILHRAIYWAGGSEDAWNSSFVARDHRLEVAHYLRAGKILVINSSGERVKSGILACPELTVDLPPYGYQWLDLPKNEQK